MTFNNKFKDLILDIEQNGSVTQPRDMKVKELTVQTLEFDSTIPFANFNKRKFNWKYFAGELAWYLRKDRDVDYIGQFSGILDQKIWAAEIVFLLLPSIFTRRNRRIVQTKVVP